LLQDDSDDTTTALDLWTSVVSMASSFEDRFREVDVDGAVVDAVDDDR
jgi:hypothetical protein